MENSGITKIVRFVAEMKGLCILNSKILTEKLAHLKAPLML